MDQRDDCTYSTSSPVISYLYNLNKYWPRYIRKGSFRIYLGQYLYRYRIIYSIISCNPETITPILSSLPGRLTTAENRVHGAVKCVTLRKYFNAMGSPACFPMLLVVFVIGSVGRVHSYHHHEYPRNLLILVLLSFTPPFTLCDPPFHPHSLPHIHCLTRTHSLSSPDFPRDHGCVDGSVAERQLQCRM